MNCSDIFKHSPGILDGTIEPDMAKLAADHLKSCKQCNLYITRIKAVAAAVADTPRTSMPDDIKKTPLSFSIPKEGWQLSRSRWERAPWFLRTGVEGIGIALAVMIVVAMVPRLRSIYEHNMEKRLDAFNLENMLPGEAGQSTATIPLGRGKSAEGESQSDEFQDEYTAEDNTTQDEYDQATGPDIRVGESEIWRFILRTDSPHEVRTKVVQTLSSLGIPKDTARLGGTEAPGGIQFDLVVSKHIVSGLKNHLQKMSGNTSHSQNQQQDKNSSSEKFTWYKNKSRKPLPHGKVRIVIWLSQT